MKKQAFNRKNAEIVRMMIEKVLNAKAIDKVYSEDETEKIAAVLLSKVGWLNRRPKFLIMADMNKDGKTVSRITVDIWNKRLAITMMQEISNMRTAGTLAATEALAEYVRILLGYVGDARATKAVTELRTAIQKELDEQESLQATNDRGSPAVALGCSEITKESYRRNEASQGRVEPTSGPDNVERGTVESPPQGQKPQAATTTRISTPRV